MDFIQEEGPDLAIDPHIAWDLEILEFQVSKDYDMKVLKATLEEDGHKVYIDKNTKYWSFLIQVRSKYGLRNDFGSH